MRRKITRWHEYRDFLADRFELRVRYGISEGQMIGFAIILLRDTDEMGLVEICRYDTAHGFAHLDLLSRQGIVRRKVPVEHLAGYQEAFIYALNDLKTNCEAYWRIFISS